jgi:hypothetical protein
MISIINVCVFFFSVLVPGIVKLLKISHGVKYSSAMIEMEAIPAIPSAAQRAKSVDAIIDFTGVAGW